MTTVEFELSRSNFGRTVAIRLGNSVLAEECSAALFKKMAALMGRATEIELSPTGKIDVYQGAEQWDGAACRLELAGLDGAPLSRQQAFDLARVLMAFSVTGEPVTTRHDARNWLVRLEPASAV